MHIGGLVDEMSAAETLSFSTDVSDTRRQRKKRGSGKAGTQDKVVNGRACEPCTLMRNFHRFQAHECQRARNLRSDAGAF